MQDSAGCAGHEGEGEPVITILRNCTVLYLMIQAAFRSAISIGHVRAGTAGVKSFT